MQIVYHCTTREGFKGIVSDGGLRPGSYVTPYPINAITPEERVSALCLDNKHKADCVCACRGNDEQFLVPPDGPLTCSNYPQMLVPKGLPVDPSSCSCADEFPWKAIGVATMIGLAVYLGFRWCDRKRKAN